MNIRLSRLAKGVLVVAAIALMAGHCLAIYNELGPSKDEWGLKYDVEVNPADDNKVTVVFTVANEGKLKPFYSTTVVAFSKPDYTGGRTYDVKAAVELKSTEDGKSAGQVQIRKEFADRAMIRILTLTVDGKKQRWASYYDIPLKKYLNKAPAGAAPTAAAPQSPTSGSKVTK